MKVEEVIKILNNTKGLILSLASIIGLSFILHTWMNKHFVSKTHFTNEFDKLTTAIKTDVKDKSEEQFLILRKQIKKVRYDDLSRLVFAFEQRDITTLSQYELLSFRQMKQERCSLGIELGLLVDCDK